MTFRLKIILFLSLALGAQAVARDLQEGDVFISEQSGDRQYVLVREMGSGAVADTFLAMDTLTNEQVVLKPIRRRGLTREKRSALVTAYAIMSEIDHPNVLQVGQVEEVKLLNVGDRYLIVPMEVARNNLQNLTPSSLDLPQDSYLRGAVNEADYLLEDLFAAIEVLNERGLVHFDISPKKVLLGIDGSFKISGFDFVRPAGTAPPNWIWKRSFAPIEYSDEALAHLSESAGDVWTASATVYFRLTGRSPLEQFAQNQRPDLFKGNPDLALKKARKDLLSIPQIRAAFEEMVDSTLGRIREAVQLSAWKVEAFDRNIDLLKAGLTVSWQERAFKIDALTNGRFKLPSSLVSKSPRRDPPQPRKRPASKKTGKPKKSGKGENPAPGAAAPGAAAPGAAAPGAAAPGANVQPAQPNELPNMLGNGDVEAGKVIPLTLTPQDFADLASGNAICGDVMIRLLNQKN